MYASKISSDGHQPTLTNSIKPLFCPLRKWNVAGNDFKRRISALPRVSLSESLKTLQSAHLYVLNNQHLKFGRFLLPSPKATELLGRA
jgi:hypothetical protein